jgi:hypothetical protein
MQEVRYTEFPKMATLEVSHSLSTAVFLSSHLLDNLDYATEKKKRLPQNPLRPPFPSLYFSVSHDFIAATRTTAILSFVVRHFL